MKSANELVYLIIALVVIISVISAAVLPVIENPVDVVTTPTTLSNADALSPIYGKYWDEDVDVEIDSTDASELRDISITINDIEVPIGVYGLHEIIQFDGAVILLSTSTSHWAIILINGNTVQIPYGTVLSIVYDKSESTVTINNADTSQSMTSDWFWSTFITGDYAYLPTTSEQLYVSEINMSDNTLGVMAYWNNSINIGGVNHNVVILVNISGVNVYTDYSGVLEADLVYNGGELVDGYSDVYTGGKLQLVLSGDYNATYDVTRAFYLVDVDASSTETMSSLIGLVAVLIILIPAMLAVRAIMGRH